MEMKGNERGKIFLPRNSVMTSVGGRGRGVKTKSVNHLYSFTPKTKIDNFSNFVL